MGGQFNEIGAEILNESDWSWTPMPGAILGPMQYDSKVPREYKDFSQGDHEKKGNLKQGN